MLTLELWADDIATCMNLANKEPNTAQANSENYIFFIAHMYHMLGTPDGGEPWFIDKQWDFQFVGKGQNRGFGAA